MLRANWRPRYKSRMTARATTGPAAPPRPCSSRPPNNDSALNASAQASVPAKYTPKPAIIAMRRPARSDNAPNTICPSPNANR